MLFLRRQLLRTLSFAFGSSFIFGRNQLAIAGQTAVQPKTAPLPAGGAVRDGIAGGTEMEKVNGSGGFFFRAKDPKALGLWYEQHLGILPIPTSYGETGWQQEAGPTAFPVARWYRQKDRKSTRLNSSHQIIPYAVFCLKKKKTRAIIFHKPNPD